MKKSFIFVLVFFFACGGNPSKEELVIADFVQTIGNVKTDMNFKLIDIAEVEPITGMDSAKIAKEKGRVFGRKMVEIKLKNYESLLSLESAEEYNLKHYNLGSREELEKTKKDIAELEEYFDKYDADTTGFGVETIYKDKYDKFLKNTDSIYARRWWCKYSIENPLLNNAKQEITRIFVLTPDGTKVLNQESN